MRSETFKDGVWKGEHVVERQYCVRLEFEMERPSAIQEEPRNLEKPLHWTLLMHHNRSSRSHCSRGLATAAVMSFARVTNRFLQRHPGTSSPDSVPLACSWGFLR